MQRNWEDDLDVACVRSQNFRYYYNLRMGVKKGVIVETMARNVSC